AKELLKEADLEDGFEMELWAMPEPRPYMPDGQKIAEVIQKDLAEVNIDAEIVSHEWATYLELAEKGEADAFYLAGQEIMETRITSCMHYWMRIISEVTTTPILKTTKHTTYSLKHKQK